MSATICALTQSLLQQRICMSTTRCSSMSKFQPFTRVERLMPSEESNLQMAFDLDSDPKKVNLAGEVYRNSDGKVHIHNAVRRAEIGVACDDSYNHEPYPPLGNPDFTRAANELVLNKAAPAMLQNRVLGIQTRSSIDALCLAAQFLREKMRCTVCMLARPSCDQWVHIFKSAGFNCQSYQYYSEEKGELNIYGLVADLMTAPEGAVVVLDTCAHNPTGLDPTVDEWKLIAHIIRCKKLLPLFHLESHGLASGDTVQDSWPVRYFVDSGFDLLCAQSFVKNFGLYNETLGHLMVVLNNSIQLSVVRGQFEDMMLRSKEKCFSAFASRIVAKILNNASLRRDWSVSLQDVHQRLQQMRLALSNKLTVLKTPGKWDHIKKQTGPHLYTNLKPNDLRRLRSKHVYVPENGRINLGALCAANVDVVAGAIHDVMLATESEADKIFILPAAGTGLLGQKPAKIEIVQAIHNGV
ncbi:PREDICTED: probable aspartate aminotransferase, cytoplasmic [Drosophila arizonae]|uniref:aspartate transaminase n=1 Tax=Drosophila arizonae TaxID=7263 RepID=A0ABM1PB97_DROAR|nr:PREDICTED: probable aspartate aminotransferase, cytoplasmic [Drosophila arizonae]